MRQPVVPSSWQFGGPILVANDTGPSSWTPLRLPFDLHAVTSVSVSTRCQSDIRGLVTSRADCFGWSGSQV